MSHARNSVKFDPFDAKKSLSVGEPGIFVKQFPVPGELLIRDLCDAGRGHAKGDLPEGLSRCLWGMPLCQSSQVAMLYCVYRTHIGDMVTLVGLQVSSC